MFHYFATPIKLLSALSPREIFEIRENTLPAAHGWLSAMGDTGVAI